VIYVTASLVIVGLFVLLAVSLMVAERHLVQYGKCKVSINEGATVLEVQGGGTLLSALSENKVFIPSACGGKGSCGYCKAKVLSGGGAVLPTEELFLTRVEARSGMRLACQVKVREDMDIQIPDFLDTVRTMVANKTFNAALKWKWSTRPDRETVYEPPQTVLHGAMARTVDDVVERHREARGGIIPVLQEINRDFGYLAEPMLRSVADQMELPISRVYSLATFYNAFSLTPKGKHVIRVCMGTACHVKGAENVLRSLERTLNISAGGTTADGLFSLEEVRCLGCCALAPVIMIGEDVHGGVTAGKLPKILDRYRKLETATGGLRHA
jgi:NADH:ubiquinone oxidoreductase subunit E/ferredoxin